MNFKGVLNGYKSRSKPLLPDPSLRPLRSELPLSTCFSPPSFFHRLSRSSQPYATDTCLIRRTGPVSGNPPPLPVPLSLRFVLFSGDLLSPRPSGSSAGIFTRDLKCAAPRVVTHICPLRVRGLDREGVINIVKDDPRLPSSRGRPNF